MGVPALVDATMGGSGAYAEYLTTPAEAAIPTRTANVDIAFFRDTRVGCLADTGRGRWLAQSLEDLWPALRDGAVSAAYEGGEVAGGDEGAFVIDDRLHLPADVLGDVFPGAGDLVLVVGGKAGHVVGGYRRVADDHG
jgi:hypothetical protein